MDTASFRMAFDRFEATRGECVYLISDAGSNFMGARHEEFKGPTTELAEEIKSNWEKQGKQWEENVS